MLRFVLVVLVFALKAYFTEGAGVETPSELLLYTEGQPAPPAVSLLSKISAARKRLSGREVNLDESGHNAAPLKSLCSRPSAHFHGFPDAPMGLQAALQSLQECRIGEQLQDFLDNEFHSTKDEFVVVEAPIKRNLLLLGNALGLGNGFVGDLVGSEGLVGGGGALASLRPRIDGGPLGFGLAPVVAPQAESEMQGVQQQYMVNYSRGPWNIQTGFQVGVMAQDLVDDTFFLPPNGVPPGTPAAPGAQPPPALQSPQDTFNRAANEAFNLAFPNGYSQGYTRGLMSSVAGTPDITLPALPTGNPQGYNEGIQVGWVQGIQEGYSQGFNQARQSLQNTTTQGISANTLPPVQSTALIQPTALLPADVVSQEVPKDLDNLGPTALQSNLTEILTEVAAQTDSVPTAPNPLEGSEERTEELDSNVSSDPKVRAFSGPSLSLIQSSFLLHDQEVDVSTIPAPGTDPVIDEELAVVEPDAPEDVEPEENDSWGSKWATTLSVAIAGAIIASFMVSAAAMAVFKHKRKGSRGSTSDQDAVTTQCSSATNVNPSEGAGSDVAAHWRSIARVLQWQEQHKGTLNTPHRSDSTTPSPLAGQTSAYMTDPTMFDFAIYNPTAQMGSVPQSPSHASEQGSERSCRLRQYQPTSCKSAGVWQESSKLKVQVNRNGW